jgi:hypothetical protein
VYNNLSGGLSLYLQVDIDSILGEFGALVMIAVLVSTVRSLWQQQPDR